jgi:hypothetical protein
MRLVALCRTSLKAVNLKKSGGPVVQIGNFKRYSVVHFCVKKLTTMEESKKTSKIYSRHNDVKQEEVVSIIFSRTGTFFFNFRNYSSLSRTYCKSPEKTLGRN